MLSPERARVLVLVAGRPATLALVTIVVLVVAALLFAGSNPAGISGAIAATWLGIHQVPLVIGKTSLGLLPLLPVTVLVWLAGRECARAVEPNSTRADLGWIVGAALAGPLAVTAICLAVAEDASSVLALQPPNTLAAFAWVGGLYLLAAVAGIATRVRRRFFEVLRLPDWAVSGLYGAGRSVTRLLACAAVLVVVAFLAHVTRLGETYRSAGDFAGVLGLTVLSFAYLPNLVVQAAGVLVGSSAHIGTASFDLFSVVGGPLPAVPLSIAVPTGPAAGWWPALLLVPAAIGVLGGLDVARTSADRITAPWATLTSAAAAALVLVLLAAVAGGELGTFGTVGLDLPILAVATFVWLALPGYAGLAFARWMLVPAGYPDRHDDYDDHDYHDQYEQDHDDHDQYDHDQYEHEHYDDEHDEHDDEHHAAYHDEDDYYDREYDADFEADHDARALEADRDAHRADPEYHDDYFPGAIEEDRRSRERRRRAEFADDYHGSRELEAEIVDEQPAIPTARTPHAHTVPEIVDVEVVEADLPDSRRTGGR